MLEKYDHEHPEGPPTVSIVATSEIPAGALVTMTGEPAAPFTPEDVVAGFRMIPETEGRVEPAIDAAAIRSALDRLGRAVEEIHAAGDALRALIGA
jgi:hypothetical protein